MLLRTLWRSPLIVPSAVCSLACTPPVVTLADAGDAGSDAGTATSGSLDGDTSADSTASLEPPAAPVLALGSSPIKRFDFSWAPAAGAEWYELLERAAPGESWVSLADDIMGESMPLTVPLHLRHEASYVLRACSGAGCTDSMPVDVAGSLASAIGYVKASNAFHQDYFGGSLALSDDGDVLVVGAAGEDSDAAGLGGDETNDDAELTGAVYAFVRDAAGQWSQAAYIKASSPDIADHFGGIVALSGDGLTLAVAATSEDSGAAGIDGDQTDDSVRDAGAVYVFVNDPLQGWVQEAYVKSPAPGEQNAFGSSLALSDDGRTLAVGAQWEASGGMPRAGAVHVFTRDALHQWSQQARLEASNPGTSDQFGNALDLSGSSDTLAVGAFGEASHAAGIDGDQTDDSLDYAGATYVYVRNGSGRWSQQAYIKASDPDEYDQLGWDVALSDDGSTLAVGARHEGSSATGIDGDEADDSVDHAGAAYVFVRDGMSQWSQQAYVKASNTGRSDDFGFSIALSDDGLLLAVGARREGGGATGIGGDQGDGDELVEESGAVYVFLRDPIGEWSQRAYLKASNTRRHGFFGNDVALDRHGDTLAVGSHGENSDSTGIGGDQASGYAPSAGAVYLF